MRLGDQLKQKADNVNEEKAKEIAVKLHAKIISDCDKAAMEGDYEIELISKNGYLDIYNTPDKQASIMINNLALLLEADGISLIKPLDPEDAFYSSSNKIYKASFRGNN